MVQLRSTLFLLFIAVIFVFFPLRATSQLTKQYYANSCPNVEEIVRRTVQSKLDKGQFPTVPATIRLFFHDCFVQGCDASVLIQSTPDNKAEKDHPDNLSLAGDGFDVVVKAKEALEADPTCRNIVSCADILAIATRDVIQLSGGPFYDVELGRLDALSSTADSVEGKLPHGNFDLDRLTSLFTSNGLSQRDMIALSAAHTVGFSHCNQFANRIYSFSQSNPIDPTIDPDYVTELQAKCPKDVDPVIAIDMDPDTPRTFDNMYFKMLQKGKGLFSSDQVLYTDARSQPLVNLWAENSNAFENGFVEAITKLGRVGVKTGSEGNIRTVCSAFN